MDPIRTTQTSDQLKAGTQFRTSDDMLVTIEQVRVEDQRPAVSLADSRIGSRFVVRDGETFTIDQINPYGGHPIYAKGNRHVGGLYYGADGRCNLGGYHLEAVQVLPPNLLVKIQEEISVLNEAKVKAICVPFSRWSEVEEIVGRKAAGTFRLNGIEYRRRAFADSETYFVELKID